MGTGSWGVAASVTKGVYFSSDGGLQLQPQRVNDEAFGQAFLGSGDLGDIESPNLTVGGRSRYTDFGYALDALAMGSPAAVTISTSASGQVTSWLHVIDLAPSIDGLAATFAFDKVRFIEELTSAKVRGFTEAVGDGGVMDRMYYLTGSKPTNISSININSTVYGATFPSLANRVFRMHGTFRINLQGASALAAGDKLDAETIDFEFERPQDAPFVFGQDYVAEPADNGWPTVKLTVKAPRFTTGISSFYAALRTAGVAFKADLTYSGVLINSTDRYTRLYQFPHLELDQASLPLEGPTQIKPDLVFNAKLAASSPAGMAFVNPFRLTLIQVNSLNAFSV
jgi:hypothetical protein